MGFQVRPLLEYCQAPLAAPVTALPRRAPGSSANAWPSREATVAPAGLAVFSATAGKVGSGAVSSVGAWLATGCLVTARLAVSPAVLNAVDGATIATAVPNLPAVSPVWSQ